MPEHVQDAIRVDWGSRPQPRELQVTCNGHAATFFVNPETNECCIRTAAGSVVKPTIFERDCGKAHCKDWQRSIRVPGALSMSRAWLANKGQRQRCQQPSGASLL